MSKRFVVLSAAVLLSGIALPANAGEGGAAYAKNLTFVGGRAVQLVEAIPAADFGWSPMEGVRNVAEAAMHMAQANYFFAGRMGHAAPEGVDMQGMGSISEKAEVVAALEASIDHLIQAFEAVEDPHQEMEIFGNPGTLEDLMQIAIGHNHEHFGQLIAYARSNEVVPPWSRSDG